MRPVGILQQKLLMRGIIPFRVDQHVKHVIPSVKTYHHIDRYYVGCVRQLHCIWCVTECDYLHTGM